MRKKLRIPLLVLLVGIAAYAAIRIPQWKTEDDIREAVFRYAFAHNGSIEQNNVSAFYLSVIPGWAKLTHSGGTPVIDRVLGAVGLAREESDRWDRPSASSGLVGRFSGHKPPVKPASECRIRDAHGVTDARGANKGLVFIAGRIRWISPTRVEVEGGYYENGTSASGNIYTLVRKNGHWVVIRDKYIWGS